MATTRDTLTQKELEKFINMGGVWAVRTVTNELWVTLDESTSGTDTYVGYEIISGGWLIKYIDTSTGTVIRFASQKNNTSTTDYSTAWTNRASLTYGLYSEAF